MKTMVTIVTTVCPGCKATDAFESMKQLKLGSPNWICDTCGGTMIINRRSKKENDMNIYTDTATFQLKSQDGKTIKVICRQGVDHQLEIHIEGYGENQAETPFGCPVLLDLWEGDIRVIVSPDINSETPQIISLSGALESNRREACVVNPMAARVIKHIAAFRAHHYQPSILDTCYGPSRLPLRTQVMAMLLDRKVTGSDKVVQWNNFRNTMFNLLGAEGNCLAAKEADFQAKAKAILGE